MGSHAYCNLIFGVPVWSHILRSAVEEEDEFLIEDLLNESGTDFQEFRHGHSAYECAYYIGIPICEVSLADDSGKKVDNLISIFPQWVYPGRSARDFPQKAVELSKMLTDNSIPFNPEDIGLYLVLAFDE
jgi:hypothetical protein